MQFQQTAAFKDFKEKIMHKSNLIRHSKILSYRSPIEPSNSISGDNVVNPQPCKLKSGIVLPILISKKQEFTLDCEKAKEILTNFNIKLIRSKIAQKDNIHRRLSQHTVQPQLNLTFGKNFRIKPRALFSRQQDSSADYKDSHSASRVMSHSQKRLVNKLFQ